MNPIVPLLQTLEKGVALAPAAIISVHTDLADPSLPDDGEALVRTATLVYPVNAGVARDYFGVRVGGGDSAAMGGDANRGRPGGNGSGSASFEAVLAHLGRKDDDE